jgi:hypothetical protein
MNGLTNAYTTIPMQSDSVRSAFYLDAALTEGSANFHGHDNVFSAQTRVSASHNFKNFQAFYGVGVGLGSYNFRPYDDVNGNYSSTIKPQVLNQYTGKKFFGALAFNGGMDAVVSFRGAEWRVIGVEASLYNEFGDYLSVRKKIPDSAATFINRSKTFSTLGFYTEIVAKTKSGHIAVKFAGGFIPQSSYHNVPDIGNFGYFNFALAASIRKVCPYLQLDMAPRATSALIGINFRLGK